MPLPFDVMILAAGRGERLRPLTDHTPKPLIDVGGQPMIVRHIKALKAIGCDRVVINLNHLADQIMDVLGDGCQFDLQIIYSNEQPHALETAGGIRNALPLFRHDQVLVINGDIVTDFDFSSVFLAKQMNMHLIMVSNPPHHPEGDFSLLSRQIDPGRSIQQLTLREPEKTNAGTMTFSGIGLYRSQIFSGLAAGKSALAPLIHHQIGLKQASADRFDGLWIDVGTEERLEQARQSLLTA